MTRYRMQLRRPVMVHLAARLVAHIRPPGQAVAE
jgi:hypothetical protein